MSGFCIHRRRLLAGLAVGPLLATAPARAGFASARLTVTVQGAGPDVVLVHGLNSSRAVWNALVAAVPGIRWHLVQIAGFGGLAAGANAGGAVLGPVTAEIARYCTENGLRRPAVIGHSMGGIIALMLGLRFPTVPGRLMVVDILPAPARGFGLDPSMRDLFDGLQAALGGQRAMAALMGLFGGDGASDSRVSATALRELAETDLGPALARLAAPLTVVYAEPPPDMADPRRIAARYRAAYPRARLEGVADSGHMVMLDKPDRFSSLVKTFLSG
ncbi:alpha/beta fold hydrolase [Sphingomonas flavalba]|uniref:alpha/beta fold hydrolase n=1 Tax=Sphingomonas flavalba TaxID=2559804 RepID=UPI00109E197B|nr:alpha/beta hydrolase [Sphingomonas flavalba]